MAMPMHIVNIACAPTLKINYITFAAAYNIANYSLAMPDSTATEMGIN